MKTLSQEEFHVEKRKLHTAKTSFKIGFLLVMMRLSILCFVRQGYLNPKQCKITFALFLMGPDCITKSLLSATPLTYMCNSISIITTSVTLQSQALKRFSRSDSVEQLYYAIHSHAVMVQHTTFHFFIVMEFIRLLNADQLKYQQLLHSW